MLITNPYFVYAIGFLCLALGITILNSYWFPWTAYILIPNFSTCVIISVSYAAGLLSASSISSYVLGIRGIIYCVWIFARFIVRNFISLFCVTNITRDPYDSGHQLLNLQSPTTWHNLGFWDSNNNQTYTTACTDLARRVGIAAKLCSSDFVLNCGVGTGQECIFFVNEFNIRRLIGIDSSEVNVNIGCRTILNLSLQHRINLQLGNAVYPFSRKESFTNMFDAVVAVDSAYHFNTRLDFFRSAHSLLRQNGRMALADMCQSSKCLKIPFMYRRMASMVAIPFENLISIAEYRIQLENVGFTEIEISVVTYDVMVGFSKFIDRHWIEYGRLTSGDLASWMKLRLTSSALRHVVDKGIIDYVIVSCKKI